MYLITYLLTAFFSLYKKKIKFLFVLFVLIYGVLYKVGQDYINYTLLYEKINFENIKELKSSYEIGFLFLMSLQKKMINNIYVFNFLVQIFSLGTLFYFLRKWCVLPYLGLNIYFSNLYFSLNIDQQRQCIAVFLFLIGYNYFEKNKILIYYLFCIAAIFFHVSAIVCLFIPFILKLKINIKLIITLYIVGNLINLFEIRYFFKMLKIFEYISFGSLLENKISTYLNSNIDQQIYFFTFGRIIRVILFIISVMGFLKSKNLNKRERNFYKLYFCYVLLLLYFYEVAIIVQRIGYFFRIFEIFVFSNIVYRVTKKTNKIIILVIILICNFSNLFKILFINSATKEAFNPYQNYILNKVILNNANEKNEFEMKMKFNKIKE